jgi:hypothetical protein
MKIREMISMPHPPYFLDLTRSDFDLFAKVKKLEYAGITNNEELSEELHIGCPTDP